MRIPHDIRPDDIPLPEARANARGRAGSPRLRRQEPPETAGRARATAERPYAAFLAYGPVISDRRAGGGTKSARAIASDVRYMNL